jgi:hypothetical protein
VTFERYIAKGYQWGAPTSEAENIDADVAASMTCRECGREGMTYDGRHRYTPWGLEYVATAECLQCGARVEF